VARGVTPRELREAVLASGLLGRDDLPSPPVVTMVSGGRDSVCLLDVAAAVRGAGGVRALHVNYGLRGEASDADERLCAELCAQLGVELRIVRVDAPERARGGERGSNLQAWARELRYGAAARLADELGGGVDTENGTGTGTRTCAGTGGGAGVDMGAPSIATGHTASDQLETILYRLAASPGRRALLGMAPREGRIVRPLLGVTREQTTAYCRERGLRWRDDESNEDERFARARVRHVLVPALLQVHPAARENVLRTAWLLREETELLEGLVDAELAAAAAAAVAGRGGSIAVARLAELHPALARLVVVRLAEEAAGEYVPQAGARVGEILALAARAAGGPAELHVGGSVGARISGGQLCMVKLPPR
jgi:tRNA(Ile)-lysidine synthase